MTLLACMMPHSVSGPFVACLARQVRGTCRMPRARNLSLTHVRKALRDRKRLDAHSDVWMTMGATLCRACASAGVSSGCTGNSSRSQHGLSSSCQSLPQPKPDDRAIGHDSTPAQAARSRSRRTILEPRSKHGPTRHVPHRAKFLLSRHCPHPRQRVLPFTSANIVRQVGAGTR